MTPNKLNKKTPITPDELNRMSDFSVKELRRICVEEGHKEGVTVIDRYLEAINRLKDTKK
jgi:hypothetical protein